MRPALEFSKNRNAFVYFIGNEDDYLYRVRLDGSTPERLQQKIDHDRVLCTHYDKEHWWLGTTASPHRWLDPEVYGPFKAFEPLLKIVNPAATRLDGYSIGDHEWSTWSKLRLSSADPKFRSRIWGPNTENMATYIDYATHVGLQVPRWHVMWNELGYASINRGINVKRFQGPDDDFHLMADPNAIGNLALETPFFELYCARPSLLPHDQLLFEMGIGRLPGRDIMLYDLNTKMLAYVAPGHSPIVLLDGATQE